MKSEQKLEVFVKELRNNLSDKDTLFEKSLREHFDSLRQKDELVLSLRVQLRQYLNDLNKANEILLQSDNRIDLLQNDLLRLDSSHKHLAYLLEQEVKRNQVCYKHNDEIINNLPFVQYFLASL